ncbi:2-oxoglutarate dehydrogenase E1 subunit family protein, partial [Rhodopirellula bahusiensis]
MNSYSLDYIDDLYVQYVRDPSSVSETWRQYFEQFLVGAGARVTAPPAATQTSAQTGSASNGTTSGARSVVAPAFASGQPGSSADTSERPGSTGDQNVDQALWLARIQDRV